MSETTTVQSFVLMTMSIGASVAIHELAHFCVARALGVGVEELSIGIGPRLISRRIGESRISVRAIPIGGFTRVASYPRSGEGLAGVPRYGVRFVDSRATIFLAGALATFVASYLLLLGAALWDGEPGAIWQSWDRMLNLATGLIDALGSILTGHGSASLKSLSSVAKTDSTVKWIARLFLNIGMLNLLPVPVLDGGALALIALENVIGRPVSESAVERVQRVGLLILAVLMLLALSDDVRQMFGVKKR